MDRPFPLKIASSHGESGPHLIHDFLDPSEPTDEMASRLVRPFLHSSLQNVPILYNGPPFPLKIAPFYGGSGFPSNIWFLWLTRVLNPNGIAISSAVFAWLTTVTDRHTMLLGL